MFTAIAPPIAFSILVWWLGTGIILYLDGMPRRTYPRSMIAATFLACLALFGIAFSAEARTVPAAYFSFACGLMIWAWLEMAFLMGFVTGPRRIPCTAGEHGFQRTKQAIETILYYELSIIAAGAMLIVLTWGAPNQTGTWTFFILFAMRLSAKLNVFLGVRNLSEEFLPEHLRYLATYFTQKNMNLFFPVSMGASVLVLGFLIEGLGMPDSTPFETTAHAFLVSLMGLAILEHVFMVMPLPLTALWNWSMRRRGTAVLPAPITEPLKQASNR